MTKEQITNKVKNQGYGILEYHDNGKRIVYVIRTVNQTIQEWNGFTSWKEAYNYVFKNSGVKLHSFFHKIG